MAKTSKESTPKVATRNVVVALFIGAHLACLTPLAILGIDYFSNNLTINPIQAATQGTGDAALIILLAALSITPLVTLTGFKPLTRLRRTVGLYAFAYALFHFILFAGIDFGFQWPFLRRELIEKPYIWLGLAALVILLALAVTSFNATVRWLGRQWKRLHRLVYLAAIIAVIHLALAIKGDLTTLTGAVWKPLAAALVLAVLLLLRVPVIKRAITRVRQKG